MNILEVAGSGTIGSNHMGPVSDTIFNLCKEFNCLGHKVTIIDTPAKDKRINIDKGIAVIEISTPAFFRTNTKNFINFINYRLNEIIYILKLKGLIDSSKFDIIHSHETWTAFLIKLLIRKEKVVYTSHTSVWCSPYYKESVKSKIFSFLLKCVRAHEKQIIQLYPLTIGLGEYLNKNIKHANIKIIPNGIFSDNKKWDNQEAKQKMGFDKHIFLITTVARVSKIKGFEVLIKAIREVYGEHTGIRVNIIGSLSGSFGNSNEITPYAQKIITMAKNLPIHFLGFINNKSNFFSYLLAASDLFILPSLFEPQGKVVLEAMRYGVPVIVSDSGGISEMVTPETGFVFRSGDYEHLSELIQFSLNNKKDLIKMRQKCYNHVRNNYNWTLIAKKHINHFETLISNKKNG